MFGQKSLYQVVKMKKTIKNLVNKYFFIINRIPFNNSFRIKRNKLLIEGKVLIKCKINCAGTNNTIICRPGGYMINSNIIIRGNDNVIIIGNDTFLKNGELWVEDSHNKIVIGDKTRICGKTHLACIEGTEIDIGKDCLFSTDIVFRTGDSHSIVDLSGNRINQSKSIIIGSHVWIGNKVTILKGSKIMDNSIIGTGSIVNSSFNEENVIISGIPAKVIKREVNWIHERIDI